MNNYTRSVKKNIKHAQLRETEELLHYFPDKSEKEQIEIINEIALAKDDIAWKLLEFLVHLNLKKNSPETSAYKNLIELITDRAHIDFKFILILYATYDKKFIHQASPLMEHILLKGTDKKILTETIKTAGREHIESLVPMISDFIYYDDQTLKFNAILTLAEIGTIQAVEYLSKASKTNKNDHNIMDALTLHKFENKQQKNKFSPYSFDIRNYLMHLGFLRSLDMDQRHKGLSYFLETALEHASRLALNLKTDEKDLIINILKILGATVPEHTLPEIAELLKTENPDQDIQFQAFETISGFDIQLLKPFDFTEIMLKALGKNPFHLRIAAASSINRINDQTIFETIKNRIETGGHKGELLTQTLIDAGAENIINYLLISDAFTYMASNYLSGNIPPASLERYIHLLDKRGLRATASRIRASAYMNRAPSTRPEAMVMSTSATAVNVYEKILFNGGYDVLSFTSPQEAFEYSSINKPSIILSDLFMGHMTAMEFALEIREFYSEKELPIIIFTNQKDFIGVNLDDKYPHAGLNKVIKFPGTLKQITAAATQGL